MGQPQWLDKNLVSIIALSGLSRNWDLRSVPTLLELATTPEQKSVLQFFANGNAVGWLLMTPPGLPRARLAAFQNGFDKTMKNADYITKIKSKDLDVNPMNHTTVEKIIADTLAVSPQTVKKIKRAMGVK